MEDTLSLIRRAHEGDKDARTQITEENMGLVYSAARRFPGRGCEYEDLVQIGCIGLLKAIDHFDLNYDVKFSTYAVPMILGEIRRFLRDDGMIRVSRSLKETAAKAFRIKEELERKLGREPDLKELAGAAGVEMEELVLAMEAAAEVESFSQTVFSGDGTPVLLGDRLKEERDPNEELLNRMLLSQLMENLEETERQILHLRYFEDCTQMQVAGKLNMTQVQVSRAEKKVLRKLRNNCVL